MTGRKPEFEEFAPAKINLYLKVGAPRTDGMHPLESLAAFANIGDRVRVAPASGVWLRVTGPFAGALAAEDDNLVLRAARALKETFAIPADQGAAIVLEKNLPVASGIGGGSADAAAALRALRRLWNIPEAADLASIARRLGADVPACLAGRAALMRGVGEILVPAIVPSMGVVLANNGDAVPTPAVYRRFDAMGLGQGFSEAPPPSAADAGSFIESLRDLPNDLEPPAFGLAPAIAALKAQVAALPGCGLARMSGSGGTIFGLFETVAAAQTARGILAANNPSFWVAAGALAPLTKSEANG